MLLSFYGLNQLASASSALDGSVRCFLWKTSLSRCHRFVLVFSRGCDTASVDSYVRSPLCESFLFLTFSMTNSWRVHDLVHQNKDGLSVFFSSLCVITDASSSFNLTLTTLKLALGTTCVEANHLAFEVTVFRQSQCVLDPAPRSRRGTFGHCRAHKIWLFGSERYRPRDQTIFASLFTSICSVTKSRIHLASHDTVVGVPHSPDPSWLVPLFQTRSRSATKHEQLVSVYTLPQPGDPAIQCGERPDPR